MRESLRSTCEAFFESREKVKEVFKWENDSLLSVCASVLMNGERKVDAAALKACREQLKAKTGVFSNFRQTMEAPFTSMMAVAEYPEEKLNKSLKYYDALKQQFWGSEYLVLAASVLADSVAEWDVEKIASRAKNIYKLMKEEHPFLTSEDDYVSAVMLAMSDKTDDKALVQEAEKAYQILKQTFSSSNDVQAAAFVLVLALADGEVEEKCEKFVTLYEALKSAGIKYGKYYELSTLAALSILPVSVEMMVEDIVAVDSVLAERKPYSGIFGVEKKTRLMHAAMIVSSEYAKSEDTNITAMVGTLAMIAAQQAAMCAVICASAAASSAAASGN